MRISVIGSGDMGGALARAFSFRHEVTITGSKPGSRTAKEVMRSGKGRISELRVEEASRSELVVLAVPWERVDNALVIDGDYHDALAFRALHARRKRPAPRR